MQACVRVYRVFFTLLLIAYFLPTSLLAFTSFGLKFTSNWAEFSSNSFFHNQVVMLNERGPQFGLTYLVQAAIYFTFSPCFAVILARISKDLVLRARAEGQVFPELLKLSLLSIFASLISFAPLLFSGYFAADHGTSRRDGIILWPVSVSSLFVSSFFMVNGLHSLFLATKLTAT